MTDTEKMADAGTPRGGANAGRGGRRIHLVGSVPLPDTRSVFLTMADALGDACVRLPDGETGARSKWIHWQEHVLKRHPLFEVEGCREDPRVPNSRLPRYRWRPDTIATDIRFGGLGYAREAIESFSVFASMKADGRLHPQARMMVALPTPFAFLRAFFAPDRWAWIEPQFERALLAEVDLIAASLPHDQIAIQWDTAFEMTALARGVSDLDPAMVASVGDLMEGFAQRTVRIGDHVPKRIELLYHFCYGDFGHKHSIEPASLQHCVDLANRISARLSRTLELVHFPVPRDRLDDAFYAPLRDLRLRPETEVALGLAHVTDGLPGTRARMAVADRFVSSYAVATECGLGRRPAGTFEKVLKLHVQLARGTA